MNSSLNSMPMTFKAISEAKIRNPPALEPMSSTASPGRIRPGLLLDALELEIAFRPVRFADLYPAAGLYLFRLLGHYGAVDLHQPAFDIVLSTAA